MPRCSDTVHLRCVQPVVSILHLEHAQRVAALCDGLLLMLDADTLEGNPLPGMRVSCTRTRASTQPSELQCAAGCVSEQ